MVCASRIIHKLAARGRAKVVVCPSPTFSGSGVCTALHLAHQFVCGYIGNGKKELYIRRKKKVCGFLIKVLTGFSPGLQQRLVDL